LVVSGVTTLNSGATAITLDRTDNDFQATVNATGGVVSLRDTNALTAALTASGAGTLQSGGALVASGSAAGLTTTSGGTTAFGVTTVNGTLGVTSTGDVTQTGALVVSGVTTLNSGATAITLDRTDNDFQATVNATGGVVSLRDTNALTAALTASGAGTLQSGGALVASGSAAGLTTTSGGTTAFDVTTVNGALGVTSTGAVTQTGALVVSGVTTLNSGATAITLDRTDNDFQATVNATGGVVSLRDTNALTAALTASGAGTLQSGGALVASGSAAGLATTSGGTTAFGVTTVNGALGVTSTGDVTQTGGIAVVGGASTFNTASGSILLNGNANLLSNVTAVTPANLALKSDSPNFTVNINGVQGAATIEMPVATTAELAGNNNVPSTLSALAFKYSGSLNSFNIVGAGPYTVGPNTSVDLSSPTPILAKLSFVPNYLLPLSFSGVSVGANTVTTGAAVATAVNAASATLNLEDRDAQEAAAGTGVVKKRIRSSAIGFDELSAGLKYTDLSVRRAACSKQQEDGKSGPAICN
jgi:hypothetical protein